MTRQMRPGARAPAAHADTMAKAAGAFVVALVVCLTVAAPAQSRPLREREYIGRPYDQVRVALIKRGILPVRRKHPPYDLDCEASKLCGRYPELLSVAADSEFQSFLFRRQADGALFRVITGDRRRRTVTGITRGDASDLEVQWVPTD